MTQSNPRTRSGRRSVLLGFSFLLACAALVVFNQELSDDKRRILSTTSGTLIESPRFLHAGKTMQYELPELAADFCMEPIAPLDYTDCDAAKPFYKVPTFGGYTNMVRLAILGAIYAYERNRCFYIDYHDSQIQVPDEENKSVLDRYTEPIGLPYMGEQVQQAIKRGHVETLDFAKTWVDLEKRRVKGSNHTIPKLGAFDMDGHRLKMLMLQRVWRPLPHVRDETCRRVESFGLKDDYIAFSVRRGDKESVEQWVYAKSEQYIESAEKQIQLIFGGKTPKIFVATDDCTVMDEFRKLRPTWQFVSECDKPEYQKEGGFALDEAKGWTKEQMDAHFKKFFTELYAMTFAKHWIGVKYTTVSWFVYFMRRANLHTLELLNTPGKAEGINPNFW